MEKNKTINIINSSFRDPSGFLFCYKDKLYRQINKSYQKHYDHLKSSGLLKKLWQENLLIPHEEVQLDYANADCYKIIKPQKLKFVSYPYEWCFDQLKDAALTTLKIQKIALAHDMILKDASAYNIQFYQGKPLLIDTLSFEKLEKNKPWVAYKQFCQHFLAPLCLSSYCDIRLNQLSKDHIDGVPLDLASKLLPFKTKLSFFILTHIHLHAKSQKYFSDKKINTERKMNDQALPALLDNLGSGIKKLMWRSANTEWGDYYNNTNYSDESFQAKKNIITEFIAEVKPRRLWDLGGNTGTFSRLSSDKNIDTVSFDIDYMAVEKNYQLVKNKNEKHLLPLFLDLSNPSPAIGWAHQERLSLQARAPVDMIMALALIHHLAISNNLPFDNIAKYFSRLGSHLIIEFVPKDDSKVQILLNNREDIFTHYDQNNFEKSFAKYFEIVKTKPIARSKRILYLLRNRHQMSL